MPRGKALGVEKLQQILDSTEMARVAAVTLGVSESLVEKLRSGHYSPKYFEHQPRVKAPMPRRHVDPVDARAGK